MMVSTSANSDPLLALLARLKLLPGLLFDHRSVSIQVLSLQANLFKLLR